MSVEIDMNEKLWPDVDVTVATYMMSEGVQMLELYVKSLKVTETYEFRTVYDWSAGWFDPIVIVNCCNESAHVG